MKALRIYLDSSALVDLCFWDSKSRGLVLANTSDGVAVATPYALFELARGFLSYLMAIHNKALQVGSPADFLAYGQRIFRMRYRQAALLESYVVFLQGLPPEAALTQRQQLELFQGDLAKRIRLGWRRAKACCLPATNVCGCRSDLPAPYLDENGYYDHSLPTKECGKVTNCGIRDHIYKHDVELRKVRSALVADPNPDEETKRRIKALSELLKLPKKDFFNRTCWDLGDLMIVHETPSGGVVVTKNSKHFAPICLSLGRTIRVVPHS
jgi:hypothetical protein